MNNSLLSLSKSGLPYHTGPPAVYVGVVGLFNQTCLPPCHRGVAVASSFVKDNCADNFDSRFLLMIKFSGFFVTVPIEGVMLSYGSLMYVNILSPLYRKAFV